MDFVCAGRDWGRMDWMRDGRVCHVVCGVVSISGGEREERGDVHLEDVYPKYGKRGSRIAEG